MNLSEAAPRTPQHLIVFGASKSGKSTLVSKLAESGFKLIWISMDRGHTVLWKLSPEAQKNVDLIILPDIRDFPVAQDTIRKLLSGNEVKLCHLHGVVNCTSCIAAGQKFSTYCFNKLDPDTIVVLDHVTQLSDSLVAMICKGKPVDYKLQLDDWGSLRFHAVDIMGKIQNAPFNIICIAQEMEAEMEDGKKRITPCFGSREFGKMLGSYFDHMIYCEVVNKSHRVGSSTTYNMSVLTGSRTDVAIEKEKEPSLIPFFSGLLKKEMHGEDTPKILVSKMEEKKLEEKKSEQAPAPVETLTVTTQQVSTSADEDVIARAKAALARLNAKKGK